MTWSRLLESVIEYATSGKDRKRKRTRRVANICAARTISINNLRHLLEWLVQISYSLITMLENNSLVIHSRSTYSATSYPWILHFSFFNFIHVVELSLQRNKSGTTSNQRTDRHTTINKRSHHIESIAVRNFQAYIQNVTWPRWNQQWNDVDDLGLAAKTNLLDIYSNSWVKGTVPQVWRAWAYSPQAKTMPIHKKGEI